jgi:hypothetical protein
MKKIKEILNPSLKNFDDRKKSVYAHFAYIIEELGRKHRCKCVENIIIMEVLVGPIKTYLSSFIYENLRNITLQFHCIHACYTVELYVVMTKIDTMLQKSVPPSEGNLP